MTPEERTGWHAMLDETEAMRERAEQRAGEYRAWYERTGDPAFLRLADRAEQSAAVLAGAVADLAARLAAAPYSVS